MKTKLTVSSFIMVLMILVITRTAMLPVNESNEIISSFENGFPILGANSLLMGKTTTLAERMEHYSVPGVSIAVINN